MMKAILLTKLPEQLLYGLITIAVQLLLAVLMTGGSKYRQKRRSCRGWWGDIPSWPLTPNWEIVLG